MTPEEFINEMQKRILTENLRIYSDLLENTKRDEATDPNWRKALDVYQQLKANEKMLFRGFIRQIMTDTLSNVFAVLDGQVWLEKQTSDFKLLHENAQLNGDLQDIFLRKEEKE